MPIFEFQCGKCGHVFEQFVFSGNTEEKRACPKCDEPDAKKIISSFSSFLGTDADSGRDCGCCGPTNRGFS